MFWTTENPYLKLFFDMYGNTQVQNENGTKTAVATATEGPEEMRIGTVNIKNFVDMPPSDVLEDAKAISKMAGIWGMQEIQKGEDTQVVLKGLGEGWTVTHGDTDEPFYTNRNWHVVKTYTDRYTVKHLKYEPPLRVVNGILVQSTRRPDLNPFAVINVHMIAGAYNGTKYGSEIPQRQEHWDQHWTHVRAMMSNLHSQGYTVFMTGDFNRRNPPPPLKGFHWIAGLGLDRVGVIQGSVKVSFISGDSRALNSDHDAHTARVRLSNRHV